MSPKVFGPYSPVRSSGQWLFVSGQIGVDPETGSVSTRVEEQAKQVLSNLKHQLESQSSQLDQVVKTTIFLKNIDDFAVVNHIYSQFFEAPYPARSCVAVADLPKVGAGTELLVEIEAVAYRGGVDE